MARLRRGETLKHLVQAFGIGFDERGQQPATWVKAGPRHHPEVDVAVGGDTLLQHQAGLDKGLQREQLHQLGNVGLGVARDVGLTGRRVGAVAARLGAQLAFGDQLPHALACIEALGAVGLDEVLGDVKNGVQTQHVDQDVGAQGHDSRGTHPLVDALDRETLVLLLAEHLRDAGG